MKTNEKFYFAYGSNMNLDQMAYRCPAAEAVCTAKLEGYELFFAGRPGNGVASIRPKQGGAVEGVLWKLTQACEKSLDHYEGFPALYGKETVRVRGSDGTEHRVTAYTMQEPYSRIPAMPSMGYLAGILAVPFPVSWTVKMKKKQKETQDILSYHTQAAGCSDKARAKASGGRQPIEECGRTGL